MLYESAALHRTPFEYSPLQCSALGGALQELDKAPRRGDDEEFMDELIHTFATMCGLRYYRIVNLGNSKKQI